MTESFTFNGNLSAITCHSWNKDRTQVAISPNNNEVHIYRREGNDWKLLDVLNNHDLRVMGIDWAPNTNRIVTCAADRNAYVWTQSDDNKWKPMLVLLRINRAATCVKWSPLENKFAVGSGARLISVCYFESENNWWVSKHIKKPIRSTVTSLDWHPNNVLLVAGSTDYKARIFSAYIKDIEDQPSPTSWGNRMPLGQLMAEYKTGAQGGGWVNNVSFSADGNRICWVGQDSAINVSEAALGPGNLIKLKTQFLPFLCCEWISPTSIVVAGHGCVPMIYTVDANNKIVFSGKLNQSQKKKAGEISAMTKFQSLDRNSRTENADTNLESVHQNAISCVCLYSGDKTATKKISTSGMDGQLVLWDLSANLSKSMQGLSI